MRSTLGEDADRLAGGERLRTRPNGRVTDVCLGRWPTKLWAGGEHRMHGAKHRTLVEVRRDDKGEGGVVALRARLLAAAAPSAAPAPATASAPACASAPASASASASATAPAAAAPAAPAASPTAAFPAARRRCEAQGIVGKHLWDMSRTCPGRVLDVSVAARRRRTSATTPRRPPHATWSRGCSSERKRVPLPSNVRPSSGERRTSPL